MIRLSKRDIPPVLQQNSGQWTQALIAHATAHTKPTDSERTRYNHPEIKTALLTETHGKCAYCESKFRHVTYGDIEHIVPKSVRVEKTFEWLNLTVACDVCNTNKGNHFGHHEDLVDPYVVEPNEHLNFVGVLVFGKSCSPAGQITETTLDLNRLPLIERRKERLEALKNLLHRFAEVRDAGIKAVLRRDLETKELADDREYAAMARVFVSEQLREIDARANLHT
jgi:5-methylcytosine-specific restriction endonuclease McrA